MRKFHIVEGFEGKAKLPVRATEGSAGYDICVINDTPKTIRPGETYKFHTGIAVEMEKDELFIINIRSSVGINRNLVLANTQAYIDSDFYPNEIILALTNIGQVSRIVESNERVAQGIFIKYLTLETEEKSKKKRKGGIGSTNEPKENEEGIAA